MKKDKWIKNLLVILFQISSFSIIIGIAISMVFISNSNNNDLAEILPIIIMSAISSIMASLYIFLLTKEYNLIKFHMSKNWIKYDLIAISMNIFNIIFSSSFITIFSTLNLWEKPINIPAIIFFTTVIIISLISVGFHQYFFYKVRTDHEKRKNGNK